MNSFNALKPKEGGREVGTNSRNVRKTGKPWEKRTLYLGTENSSLR
jgi:hypothetical protein